MTSLSLSQSLSGTCHVGGSVLAPEVECVHEEAEQVEGLLFGHVHEEDGGDEAHALAVAHVVVYDGVRPQHVVQRQLPQAVLLREVRVSGERAVCNTSFALHFIAYIPCTSHALLTSCLVHNN